MIHSPYARPGDHAFISNGAEQLLQIFRTGFEREWVLEQLKSVSDVIVTNAETELHVLDLFAVYFAIRRHPAQIWQQHGAALYEQFLAQVLTWWCTEANGSMGPQMARHCGYSRQRKCKVRSDRTLLAYRPPYYQFHESTIRQTL